MKKAAGTFAVPTLGIDVASYTVTSTSTEVKSKEIPFIELMIEAINPPTDAPESALCITQPPFSSEGDKRDRIYLGKDWNSTVNLTKDTPIIATPHGLRQSSEKIQLSNLPTEANISGSGKILDNTNAPLVELEDHKSGIKIKFEDVILMVSAGQVQKATTSIDIPYGYDSEQETIDVSIAANHYGTSTVLGHPNQILLPKTERLDRMAQHIKKSQGNSSKMKTQTKSTVNKLEMTEYSEIGAYGIKITKENKQ